MALAALKIAVRVPPMTDLSVAKVSFPRVNEREPGPIRNLDHLGVSSRTTGLDDCGHPGRHGGLHSVRKRKKCIRGEHGFPRAGIRLVAGDSYGVDPAGLPAPHADEGSILRQQDRVRAYVRSDAPREEQVLPLGLGRNALRHDLEATSVRPRDVLILDQDRPGYR